MPDLRPAFSAEGIRAAARLTAAAAAPRLRLDPDTVGLLRSGLGRYDMELRWLAHLDDTGVLRLWRSWTGHQIYQVTEADGGLSGLAVEQDPEHYRGGVAGEPGRFEAVLALVVNDLRMLRAGHTPYGPVPGADPAPAPWPALPGWP
jgi:hypothetical protein